MSLQWVFKPPYLRMKMQRLMVSFPPQKTGQWVIFQPTYVPPEKSMQIWWFSFIQMSICSCCHTQFRLFLSGGGGMWELHLRPCLTKDTTRILYVSSCICTGYYCKVSFIKDGFESLRDGSQSNSPVSHSLSTTLWRCRCLHMVPWLHSFTSLLTRWTFFNSAPPSGLHFRPISIARARGETGSLSSSSASVGPWVGPTG